jgi:protocatechuate 4,5-dioxygenase alpha chain
MIEFTHGFNHESSVYFWQWFANTSSSFTPQPLETCMAYPQALPPIPGTTPFDGDQARKGYALNKMCFSFNTADNRTEFQRDEETYMRKYGLNAQQADAIRARNVLQLIAAGGNAYYLAKFAGIFGLDMQDLGAQQTGMTKDEFKAKLRAAAND